LTVYGPLVALSAFPRQNKSGILKFPSGMAGKRQKIKKIPPKAGRLAAMVVEHVVEPSA